MIINIVVIFCFLSSAIAMEDHSDKQKKGRSVTFVESKSANTSTSKKQNLQKSKSMIVFRKKSFKHRLAMNDRHNRLSKSEPCLSDLHNEKEQLKLNAKKFKKTFQENKNEAIKLLEKYPVLLNVPIAVGQTYKIPIVIFLLKQHKKNPSDFTNYTFSRLILNEIDWVHIRFHNRITKKISKDEKIESNDAHTTNLIKDIQKQILDKINTKPESTTLNKAIDLDELKQTFFLIFHSPYADLFHSEQIKKFEKNSYQLLFWQDFYNGIKSDIQKYKPEQITRIHNWFITWIINPKYQKRRYNLERKFERKKSKKIKQKLGLHKSWAELLYDHSSETT